MAGVAVAPQCGAPHPGGLRPASHPRWIR